MISNHVTYIKGLTGTNKHQQLTSVEISETQERLYIFNLSRFRPILNDLYFISCQGESTQGEDLTYIFDCLDMEETLIGVSV